MTIPCDCDNLVIYPNMGSDGTVFDYDICVFQRDPEDHNKIKHLKTVKNCKQIGIFLSGYEKHFEN